MEMPKDNRKGPAAKKLGGVVKEWLMKISRGPEDPHINVDYPGAGEVIRGEHYTVRISGPRSEDVEISLDGGDWTLCRKEGGYWWFDLRGLADGAHELAARIVRNGGTRATRRKFKVLRE